MVHFHRIFTAYVGENISSYVRRLRMERAAQQLLDQSTNVTDIAFDSGYETHSAFSRAFKQYFGVSPSEFRELSPIAAAQITNRRIFYNRKDLLMQPQEIRTLPDTKVLYARATEVMGGPAYQAANIESFNRLGEFLGKHNLSENVKQIIAVYPDEPEIGKEVRFDAGAILAEGAEPAATEVVAAGLNYQTLSGGRWAIFRHIGPYENLWKTWQGAYRDWLSASGEELRDAIPFEDYVNDPREVASEELLTDIYVPLK